MPQMLSQIFATVHIEVVHGTLCLNEHRTGGENVKRQALRSVRGQSI